MITKFRYHSEIFAIIANFRYVAKITMHSENSTSCFCDPNDFVLINSSFALNLIILFRLFWYFRMFVGLYKPCDEHFVT